MCLNDSRRDTLVQAVAEAMALPEGERAAFLRRATTDEEMYREALSLIGAADKAGAFLASATIGTERGRAGPETGTARADAERAGSMIGRYRLLEQIGEGGFGVVFMAEQREPVHRRVALKVIKLGMDTRAVIARFEAERQALAMMDHPGIARVLDAGATEAGRPYFVMELVRGEPIDRYCDARRLTTRQRLELFAQVCHAVQHAHAKGVIHRDIKPGNVLVAEVDGRPLAKVIDFGIAKATAARLTEKTLFTEFRQLVGTPEYMSPEQAGAGRDDVDTRTDVYSLGVLLYELLIGATPFDANRLRSAAFGEMQRIIREDDPPRPSTRLSAMPETIQTVAAVRQTEPRQLASLIRGELDWIVMRCLEKDRARRYATAIALAEDIERHLKGEPVSAAPPSTAYRMRKFARRHRLLLGAATAIAFALVAGLAGTSYALVRAVRAERLAVERYAQGEQARREADEARELAEKSNRVANSVTEFFTQDLLSLSPRPAGTPEVTVREVLDDVPRKIDKYFKSDPAVEGVIRERVGQLYRRLGELQKSSEYLEDAVPLLEQGLGPESKATLSAIHRLGELKMDLRDYAAAEAQFDKAYQGRLKAYGLEYVMTANSLLRRGAARVSGGKMEAGLTDLRTVVAHAEREHGRESRNYVLSVRALAEGLRTAGLAPAAADLLRGVLETIRQKSDTLGGLEWATRHDLCNALIAMKDGPGAMEQSEAAMGAASSVYPPDHPIMVDLRLSRGLGLVLVNRLEEAATELEAAHAAANTIYGAGNDYSKRAATGRAEAAERAGDAAAAALWRERAK